MRPGLACTGATFADAPADWLRYVEHDGGRKPSTVAGYKVTARSIPLSGVRRLLDARGLRL